MNKTILTFIIKPIHLVDFCRLMIPPEHEEVLRVLDLVAEQKEHRLKRHLPPVNIIPQKQVISRRWKPTILEESHQIKKLAMDVTHNVDW